MNDFILSSSKRFAVVLSLLYALPTKAELPATQPAKGTTDATMQLTFPENVELRVLIEFVSQRLKFNVFYDQQAVAQQVTLRAPSSVTEESLLPLLESVLQSKGLALVDSDQPGWKRIVPAAAILSVAKPATNPTTAAAEQQSAGPTTLVLKLEHADVQKAEQLIKPFLTQPGGSLVALADQRLLIITDYGSNTRRLNQLVQLIDQPERPVVTKLVTLSHVSAELAASKVATLLSARQRARGPAVIGATTAEIIAEPRTNSLVVIGSELDVESAESVARTLDVAIPESTVVYRLKFLTPARLDRAMRQLLGPQSGDVDSSVDELANLLTVRGPLSVHATLQELVAQLDRPTTEARAAESSPIRFYRLENTTADEALATIEAIIATDSGSAGGNSGLQPPRTEPSLTSPVKDANEHPDILASRPQKEMDNPVTVSGRADDGHSSQRQDTERKSIQARNAVVTADPNTNSIVVVAPLDEHPFFQQLIKMLDKRRAQVLIECTIVTLDTSEDFSLGVETSVRGGNDRNDLIVFSSFGLSRVGSVGGREGNLGRLSLIPGLGFNGAVISTDIADIVVKALMSSGRAQVVSAPRILVNDNATGTLASVQEAPFTSVNASSTVATTSFAGYASAGTSINLTPHVSEGDFLQLEYTIALNSFTGASNSQSGTPPPRQTNQLQSRVTIPDGSTIVVGGLNRRDRTRSVDAIPILGQIPIIEYFFSSRSKGDKSSTLFVFIRPIILRDDRFADLKFYSQQGLSAAELPSELPTSQPMLLR